MTRCAPAVVCALVASSLVARAETITGQAAKLYGLGEYPAAIRLLERSLAGGLDDREEGDAQLLLAAAQFATGDTAASRLALQRLFEKRPAFVVPTSRFPPPFIALCEDVRHSTRAPPPLPPPPPPLEAPPPPLEVPHDASVESTSPAPSRWWAALPAAVGAVGLGLSVWFLGQAKLHHDALTTMTAGASLDDATAQQHVSQGKSAQLVGGVSLGVGAVGVVTAVVLFWLGAPSPPVTASLTAGSGAWTVSLGACW